MDWFLILSLLCMFLLLYIYYEYIENENRNIKFHFSISHSNDTSLMKKIIEIWNIPNTKILIKGSKCMDYVDQKTNGKIKGEGRKNYFSDKTFVNNFLNYEFGFTIKDIYHIEYANGKWRDYMENRMNISNIIDFGSSSIKDSSGNKFKINTLDSSIDEIKVILYNFDSGTIVATQSMRTMKLKNKTKYDKLIEIFSKLGFKYKLLSTKEESIFTCKDSITYIDEPYGRYLCIDIGDISTQITVYDC